MTQFEKITSETLSLPTGERAELAEILIQSLDEKEEYSTLLEKLEVLQEIRVAESQLEAGLGVQHDLAKKQVLSALRTKNR